MTSHVKGGSVHSIAVWLLRQAGDGPRRPSESLGQARCQEMRKLDAEVAALLAREPEAGTSTSRNYEQNHAVQLSGGSLDTSIDGRLLWREMKSWTETWKKFDPPNQSVRGVFTALGTQFHVV